MVEKTGQKTKTEQAISLQYAYDWNQDGRMDEVNIAFERDQLGPSLLEGHVDVFLTVDGQEERETYKFALPTDLEGLEPLQISSVRHSKIRDRLLLKGQTISTEKPVKVSLKMSAFFGNKILTSDVESFLKALIDSALTPFHPVFQNVDDSSD